MKRLLLCTGLLALECALAAPAGKTPVPVEYFPQFSTFFGEHDPYSNLKIVTDRKGNIYAAGTTRARDFPTTPGAYQTALKGESDAFVAKFSPEGRLIFSTLIGGSGREHHVALAVDDAGNIFLAGGTGSADFPVTAGAYETKHHGGPADWPFEAYVLKLDATGNKVLWATFLGGGAMDGAFALQLDKRGNPVVAGVTKSADFPTTPRAFQRKHSGDVDAYVAKIRSDGRALLFSTLFGGSGQDFVSDLALDASGNVFLSGASNSPDLPVTANAIGKRFGGKRVSWGGDGYLAKLSSDGRKLQYLTYLGAEGDDTITTVAALRDRIWVAGTTGSARFPVSPDALRSTLSGGKDVFVAAFHPKSMRLEYATYFGGAREEVTVVLRPLSDGRVVLGGATFSPDLPVTGGACDSPSGGGKLFLSVLDLRERRVAYSTCFGGGERSYMDMDIDSEGNVAALGVADSSTFTPAPGGFRGKPFGQESFVVMRFQQRVLPLKNPANR